ncbi:MAG: DNA repair protein RadA [Nocardioides sp.]
MTTKQRNKPAYRCAECGWEAGKWVGRCGECQAWGSVAEARVVTVRTTAGPVSAPAVPIAEVSATEAAFASSGVPELDRVLGGGLVPGAAILLAGEPGVGKSTLLLEVAARTAQTGRRTLYVTGEESASQVRLRADRTGGVQAELYLAAETDLGAVLTHVEETRPGVVVIDSVQTISAIGVEGVAGGVTQVREVAAAMIRVAKTHHITMIMIGHVTKEGAIAGPRALEHLVDVVLTFEGERNSRFRVVRAGKNRFGPIDEVGCFELGADGIRTVLDPTGLFLENRRRQVPGTCVAVTMEGQRPMLAEVQALVTPSASERPRRTTSGVDSARLAMVLAVLQQHCGIRLHAHDVFVSTVGGARLTEPASDLALAVAVASSYRGRPALLGVVAIGELGLAGDLRRVRDLPQRIGEAGRVGFAGAIVPGVPEAGPRSARPQTADGLRVIDAPDITAALRLLVPGEEAAGTPGTSEVHSA